MRPLGWDCDFVFQDELVSNPHNPKSDSSAVGRTDDLIVLANGAKVIPRLLESALIENEHVKAAIAFGDGQFELGIIVQPSAAIQAADYDRFKTSSWPTIVEAMKSMDAHARILSKEAIFVVPHDTALPRSDKGSLMRREVYKAFDAEIAAVYEALENSLSNADTIILDMDNLEQDLKNLIQDRLAWKVKPDDWTFSDDFFALGMDSLQAVKLRRHILCSFTDDYPHIQIAERVHRDIVYRNHTVTYLAQCLKTSAAEPPKPNAVDDLVAQFSIQPGKNLQGCRSGSVVLLTGGSGSLGSHLLPHLASLSNVDRIFCLNRPQSITTAQARQLESLTSRGININPTALDNWDAEWGSMISIEAELSTVLSFISSPNASDAKENVEIACYNGPTSHVLVGARAVIDRLQDELSRASIKYKRLNVTHGFHSKFTGPLLPEIYEVAGKLTFRQPTIALQTCTKDQNCEDLYPQFIIDHTRTPVYFGQAVERLSQSLGPSTWIKAGSNSSITAMVRRALDPSTIVSHVFQPIHLDTADAVGTLAEATTNI
ncbi:MAG: hypothetical protein Q9186_005361 [Xanthomendoza sp. 1 TL-2023]